MEKEPESTDRPDAPSIEIRLFWWFGIYLAGQVPLMVAGSSPIVAVFFPMILGCMFVPFMLIFPESIQTVIAPVLLPVFYVAGFGFYFWHLYKTLTAKTRRRFFLWLLLLVAIVIFNQFLVSCMGTQR
jgi:hypothetical protein